MFEVEPRSEHYYEHRYNTTGAAPSLNNAAYFVVCSLEGPDCQTGPTSKIYGVECLSSQLSHKNTILRVETGSSAGRWLGGWTFTGCLHWLASLLTFSSCNVVLSCLGWSYQPQLSVKLWPSPLCTAVLVEWRGLSGVRPRLTIITVVWIIIDADLQTCRPIVWSSACLRAEPSFIPSVSSWSSARCSGQNFKPKTFSAWLSDCFW